MADLPLVLGITGASGSLYATRLLDVLLRSGREVHLCISESATQVFRAELGLSIDLDRFDPALLTSAPTERLHYWNQKNFSAGIASGSFRTAGMAIVPCSMSTLAAIASGMTTNLITRAADVHLKERRKLILTPRETPLNLIGLENMVTVTRAGAIVLPAMPGFYHQPQSIDDLINFVVGRICDQLGLDAELIHRWGGASEKNRANNMEP